MSKQKYDPVDRPAHYNMGGIECIDYIKQVLGLQGYIDYCHGNMIKYQHGYAASARFITEFDRMIDTIINRMGV